jgi:hypothetical protein
MKERPILFSAPMVRALLEGTKTQTRRVVARGNSVLDWDGGPLTKWPGLDFAGKIHPGFPRAFSAGALRSSEGAPQGVVSLSVFATGLPNYRPGEHTSHRVYPRWRVGDRLWVKETWRASPSSAEEVRRDSIHYRADLDEPEAPGQWRPSIYMSRRLSRITLEITELRVQRLQDISGEDAIAEGIRSTLFRPDDGFPLCTGYSPEPDDGKSILYPSEREAYASLWERINGPGSWSTNPWVWALTFKRVTP